jgi:hypothetical protein
MLNINDPQLEMAKQALTQTSWYEKNKLRIKQCHSLVEVET